MPPSFTMDGLLVLFKGITAYKSTLEAFHMLLLFVFVCDLKPESVRFFGKTSIFKSFQISLTIQSIIYGPLYGMESIFRASKCYRKSASSLTLFALYEMRKNIQMFSMFARSYNIKNALTRKQPYRFKTCELSYVGGKCSHRS